MARSEKLVAEVRRIADSTRSAKDKKILHYAAGFIESLDREIQTVAEIGHRLITTSTSKAEDA